MSTKIHKCIDCGGKVSRRFALRCKTCSNRLISKNHIGKKSPNYKHGKYCINKAFCLDCGIKIHRTNQRCSKCWLKYNRGSNNVRWTGNSPLIKRIRTLDEYNKWRLKIFKRDKYTCQICNKKGKKLNCHHIKAFSKLLKTFLLEYDQFSPVEDNETLVRLATKWLPFWNLNNGTTLCQSCHCNLHPSMNFNYQQENI